MEGGLEKILLQSFSPTLRPISSDIKHGEKSLPLKKNGRWKIEQRLENTRSITSDVDKKKIYIYIKNKIIYINISIKNGLGLERILARFRQRLYLFIPCGWAVLCFALSLVN